MSDQSQFIVSKVEFENPVHHAGVQHDVEGGRGSSEFIFFLPDRLLSHLNATAGCLAVPENATGPHMALASSLTEKSLAKFRTKPCERLLTKNECSFGDRCQYAHSVPRRNPKHVSYSPEMCSSPATCHLGDACPKAHTVEECLYHPTMYRTQLCPEKKQCTMFYCPHAHAEEELRRDPPRWWPAGDQKDLHVRNSGEVPPLQSYGFELCGGLVRPAKYVPDAGLEAQPCFAKLLSTSRSESQLANRVVKDLKRWLSKTPLPAPFFLRRTVATTALAVPSHFRVLGKTLESLPNGVLQEARKCWAVTQLVAKWIRQLVNGLEALHDLDIAHSCIGPSTILVGPGVGGLDIRVGDFLGKVTTLRNLENGCSSLDESWAMWYPAEVHLHVSTAVPAGATHFSSKTAPPDLMRVDSWQLGVLIFFLLTGAHPFGNVDCPGHVCSNIRAGNVANRKKLEEVPLFLELVDRLIASEPHRRLKVSQVSGHPVFWDLQEGIEFAKPLLTDPRRAREQEWLYHLPCFAVFAPPTRDVPRLELLSKLCQKVLDIGNKRRSPHKGLGTICVQLLSEIDRHRPVQAPQHAPAKCASSPPSGIPPPRPDVATYFQAGMRRGAELMAGFALDSLMQPPPGLGPSMTPELLHRCSLAAAEMVLYQQHCQAHRQGLHQMGHEAQDWHYGHIPQQDFSLYHPDPDGHSMLMHEYDTYVARADEAQNQKISTPGCRSTAVNSSPEDNQGSESGNGPPAAFCASARCWSDERGSNADAVVRMWSLRGMLFSANMAIYVSQVRDIETMLTKRLLDSEDNDETNEHKDLQKEANRVYHFVTPRLTSKGLVRDLGASKPGKDEGDIAAGLHSGSWPQLLTALHRLIDKSLQCVGETAQSEAQNALAQCLSDFEVVPELVPKAAAFSVFREVAKTAIVPREVQKKVAPDEAGESGRFFTYSHFACSLAVTAQRAFASAGASSLVRLMQWMDASKGRVLFSQNFPGTAPKGCAISLKVLPEMDKLPEDVQRDLAAVTLKQATGQEPAQSRQEAPAPAEEVGRPRRSRSVTSLTREPRAAAAPLPEWARLEIQKTFGHYASLGDPLNRSTLTSQKFGRFLRDCGLLAIEADGPVSFDFAPEGQESATSRQGTKLRPRPLELRRGAPPEFLRGPDRSVTALVQDCSAPARVSLCRPGPWGKVMQLSCLPTPVDCRAGSCVKAQVADANWKLQQWRGDISRDYFEEEIVPQSPRTILPLARIAARGHGFLSGAELAGFDAAQDGARKAGEAKTMAVDVAPIPGYDPSSIAGWSLHPPSSDQAEAEPASDSAFQTAVVEPDLIFDSVFPEEPLPGRPQHRMVPKDVAAAGKVHAGVQTRPEELEIRESSNQRFAREAVARIGLVPLTICDAAACPEFRLQRCHVDCPCPQEASMHANHSLPTSSRNASPRSAAERRGADFAEPPKAEAKEFQATVEKRPQDTQQADSKQANALGHPGVKQEEQEERREPSFLAESSSAGQARDQKAAGPSSKPLQPPTKARRPPSATPRAEGPGSAGPPLMSEDATSEERAEATEAAELEPATGRRASASSAVSQTSTLCSARRADSIAGSMTFSVSTRGRRRSVLNPAAVIQDLEASEEYEYARLFRVLLEIQRTGDPDSSCLRDFLAENCEVTDLVLDALPFLQKVEGGEIVLPASADMRTDPTFREFLQTMRERCVSNATLLRIFTKLGQRGSAPIEACRAEAQRFCLDRFDANLRQSEWEQMLQAAFDGAGEELTPGQWMQSCRWAARASRLIMTLRLTCLSLVTLSSFATRESEDRSCEDFRVVVHVVLRAVADSMGLCVTGSEATNVLMLSTSRAAQVIVPLNGVLLRSRSEELVCALDVLDKTEVKRLMTDCSAGLNKLFACYATEPTARRPHWNSDSVTRFAIDFDFLAEVSNLPLQRMFQAEEKLLVEGFPLFLLMLANKTHTSQVPILFQRINAIACPGSREMPGPRRSFSATPGRSDRLEGSRRAEETGLSWDELLLPDTFESF
ncbi:ireA [Symbiodinium microadriaticum]|nr:ireA [Symbiodinium microadriaticum]